MKTAANIFSLAATFSLLGLGGCAHQQPLMSHAHVGHCLTHWYDTPDNRGLLEVASEQLARARSATDAALAVGSDPALKTKHLGDAARALKAEGEPEGPDSYGAIRAFDSALEHLEYAGTSEDASPNLVASVATLSEMGVAISERLRAASVQARTDPPSSNAISLDRKAVDLRALLNAVAAGVDSNGNGTIEPNATEAGLEQFRAQLDDALAREMNPAYQPLARKYLLGIVRLPDGKWAFLPWNKLARPNYGY